MAIERARPVTDLLTDEVVAGLVNDDAARQVAESSIALAAELGCRVRFVHVVPEAPDPGDDDGDSAVFHTVMRALRGARVPVAFEVVTGDPVEVLLDRSRVARALVVGPDRSGLAEDEAPPSTASACARRAACEVHTVGRHLVGRGGPAPREGATVTE